MTAGRREPRSALLSWPALVVALVAVLAAGVCIGALWLPAPVPAAAEQAGPAEELRVTATPYDDDREVAATPSLAASAEVTSPRDGIVTTSACEAGGAVSSGDVLVTIDAVPVIALRTEYPLYRDLSAGETGPDVRAVQEALVALGYPVGRESRWDQQTAAGWHQMVVDRGGGPAQAAGLDRSMIATLAASPSTGSVCQVEAGQSVATGDALVTIGGELLALTLSTDSGWTPGERVVVLDDLTAPVDADGRVTDPAFLAAVVDTEAYRMWAAAPGDEVLRLRTRLAQALTTYPVPPAALSDIADGQGCLSIDASTSTLVRILSSSLGTTYVAPVDGELVDRVWIDGTSSVPPCR